MPAQPLSLLFALLLPAGLSFGASTSCRNDLSDFAYDAKLNDIFVSKRMLKDAKYVKNTWMPLKRDSVVIEAGQLVAAGFSMDLASPAKEALGVVKSSDQHCHYLELRAGLIASEKRIRVKDDCAPVFPWCGSSTFYNIEFRLPQQGDFVFKTLGYKK